MSTHTAQDIRPFVGRNDIAKLTFALDDGRWHLAASLAPQGLTDRLCRAIAEEKPDLFVTGNQGYKLTEHASVEEIEACAKRLASQAEKMKRRADALFAVATARSRSAA